MRKLGFFKAVLSRLKKRREKEGDEEENMFLGAVVFYIVPLHCYKMNIK